MNYLAHGHRFLDDAYVVAGTAVPDWLNVVNRRSKARSKYAAPLADEGDSRVRALAKGIIQHHHDDDWFHRTLAFNELSLQFTAQTRSLCSNDPSMRASFVGHILVELLLDAALAAEQSQLLDEYYAALQDVDAALVEATVNRIARVPPIGLAAFVDVFRRSRFLYDYLQDDKLLFRINNVMRRVRLAPLPAEFQQLLPAARKAVASRTNELMTVGAEKSPL